MEKRFLLATFVSLLILILWGTIVPRPPQEVIAPDTSQPIVNKNVTDNNVAFSSTPPSLLSTSPAPGTVEKRIETIETDKLTIEFSNIGGTINKVRLKEYAASLPVRGMGGLVGLDNVEFVTQRSGESTITYWRDETEWLIERTYNVSLDDYRIDVDTKVTNKSNMSKQMKLNTQGLILDMSNVDLEKPPYLHDRGLFEYVISSSAGIVRKNNAFKFTSAERKEQSGSVPWIGFRDRYFCLIFKPQHEFDGYIINPLSNNELEINLLSQPVNVAPGENIVLKDIIFAGPEKAELLQPYKFGFEDIKRYYRATLFDAIAKIIYSALNWIHKIVRNWGVAILLISAIIYFAMYPLTLRSMLSMRKMQTMQPKIASIREKYKDNPQKMNTEVMELYKKHKINPFSGGCLPMLLQMPVFIGLYQVLWRSVSFKGANFLWIKDLSEPDRLFILPIFLPFLGNEINLLPVIMIAIMVFQQKLTSKSMGVTDPMQATQQKMMSVFMPIFLGVIFYHFASGLTLYFTAFYAFSTFTQWKMSKHPAVGQET